MVISSCFSRGVDRVPHTWWSFSGGFCVVNSLAVLEPVCVCVCEMLGLHRCLWLFFLEGMAYLMGFWMDAM